jgi:hypothetical protein
MRGTIATGTGVSRDDWTGVGATGEPLHADRSDATANRIAPPGAGRRQEAAALTVDKPPRNHMGR